MKSHEMKNHQFTEVTCQETAIYLTADSNQTYPKTQETKHQNPRAP